MNPLDAEWDVIVIGTGIGGGTAARALAEAGLKVLMLEQGSAGYRREETALDLDMADPVTRRLRGYWPEKVRARIAGQEIETFAPLGAGIGGSSVFYAATLERPEIHDLDDSQQRPHPTGGWPVTYDTLAPYLDRAEELFAVAPAPVGPGDRALMERLEANGIHPYPLNTALRRVEGCLDCLGHKCPRGCKMDGRSAGVEPALATGNAALVTGCEVTAIRGDRSVEYLEVSHAGEARRLHARRYVLAGGALGSPRLLLASGFGNSSGLAGRGLMFHLNEMLAVWPRTKFEGASKALGFRDFYWQEGQRLGMVQAMGMEAGFGEILHFMRLEAARSALFRRIPGLDRFLPIPAAIAERLFGNAKVFVGLLEDLPYDDNRVEPDPTDPRRISLHYDFAPELLARRESLRKAMRRAFRGNRRMFLGRLPELNLGHPCGTLRMGTNPKISVVSAIGRSHDAPNLYVADASVFPTSMGVNPSLTIAAHALHMAKNLCRDLRENGQ